MSNSKLAIATDQQDVVAELEKLRAQFEAGEITCAALRVYHTNGTFEDIVVGGAGDEERAEVLAQLHAKYAQRH